MGTSELIAFLDLIQVSLCLQEADLRRLVLEDDVPFPIAAMLPRLHQDDVPFPDPEPALEPAGNPAVPGLAVQAADNGAASAHPLLQNADGLGPPRQLDSADILMILLFRAEIILLRLPAIHSPC